MDCPPLPEASHAKAHQDSKGVVDEPSSETNEKESQIDLKKKIKLIFQTFKPDPRSMSHKWSKSSVSRTVRELQSKLESL